MHELFAVVLVLLSRPPVREAAAGATASSGGEVVRTWLNGERARGGAPGLSPSAALDRVAQERAEEVAAAANPEDAETPAEEVDKRARRAGYEHDSLAEVVLTGGEDLAPRLEAWRHSGDETFAEALRPEYRDLGVGLARRGERLVVALVFGLSSGDAFASRTAKLADLRKVREELLARVNAERVRRRLPPLRENARLDGAAQEHAEDMLRRSYYGHETPEGATAMDRAARAAYEAAAIGENIAEGQSSVEQVMDGWMKSPEHREHVLSRAFSEIGLGVAFGRNARGYQVLWVQVFGVPGPGRTAPGRGRLRR